MSNDFWPLWRSSGSISIRILRLLLISEAQHVLRRHLLQDKIDRAQKQVTQHVNTHGLHAKL